MSELELFIPSFINKCRSSAQEPTLCLILFEALDGSCRTFDFSIRTGNFDFNIIKSNWRFCEALWYQDFNDNLC